MSRLSARCASHIARVQNNDFYSIKSADGWLHQSCTCWTDVYDWAWRGDGKQLRAVCQKYTIDFTRAEIVNVTDKVLESAGKSPSKMPAPDNRRRVAVMK